jgi:hypothetical protein
LVAYYQSDETEGDLVPDRAGNLEGFFQSKVGGYTAAIPRWLPSGGKLAGALEFFAPETRVDIPNPALSADYTVSLWLKTYRATSAISVDLGNRISQRGRGEN